jgi:ABC-2 type transport system ATP-binding protein
VEIRDLRVRFGETTAVDDVDLEVGAGEVFGPLGPNGAGKTTTIIVLTTLLPATKGTARVFGVDVARHPMDVRRLLGRRGRDARDGGPRTRPAGSSRPTPAG